MKAIVLCFLTFLVICGAWFNGCGPKSCSPAQVCKNGECVCKPRRCFMSCPFGFKKDENGCFHPCICNKGNEYVPQNTCGSKCSPGQTCVNGNCVCTPKRCEINCPLGFKRDVNGCEYPCTCAEDNYPQCGINQFCTEAQVCERGKCQCSKFRCTMYCQFGFKVDENGCEYPCTCAEKPLFLRKWYPEANGTNY